MMLKNPLQNSKLEKYPNGSIYQLFGENIALYQKAIGTNGHNGIDIIMPENTPVLASTDGVIAEIKDTPTGYGKHIRLVSDLIDGFYWETTYGHLNEIKVIKGQKVNAGDEIGLEGNTGFVISGNTPYWGNAPAGKGIHLHFGLRKLTDEKPNTHQINYLGKGYTVADYLNGFFGYMDPMPYFKKMYEHIKINNDQYILIPEIKFAYSISRPEILFKLQQKGLGNLPKDKGMDYIDGYVIIKGSTEDDIKEMFNIK